MGKQNNDYLYGDFPCLQFHAGTSGLSSTAPVPRKEPDRAKRGSKTMSAPARILRGPRCEEARGLLFTCVTETNALSGLAENQPPRQR